MFKKNTKLLKKFIQQSIQLIGIVHKHCQVSDLIKTCSF